LPALVASILLIALQPTVSESGGTDVLRLATTTSTADSGLLDAILSDFETRFHARVDVIAVGTGQALALGRAGDADVLLVHARDREDEFLAAGHATYRSDVMYNDFVLVGPRDDPANTKAANGILDALARIAQSKAIFASRGDDSGTHSKEIKLWALGGIGLETGSGWYHALGQGMGATLTYANERSAYTLTDRATFLSQIRQLSDLEIQVGGQSIRENQDARLRNPYGVLVVSDAKSGVNSSKAKSFVQWIVSPDVQRKIASFRSLNGTQPLFYPVHNEIEPRHGLVAPLDDADGQP
jgi:tungstate transport system substrate-binding protein